MVLFAFKNRKIASRLVRVDCVSLNTTCHSLQLVGEAEVQKYMFTYHSEGQLYVQLYCTFRSNKYISAC